MKLGKRLVAPSVRRSAQALASSLRHRHQFKDVIDWIFEINTATTTPIIELAVVEGSERGRMKVQPS
jgi:hypothetical protein